MKSYTALCTYRVQEGKDGEFLALLLNHAPTLYRLGLLTSETTTRYRGTDESGKSFFVEFLDWKSTEGPNLAEQMPEVLRIWEGMGKLVEARLGRPPMEFPFVEPVSPA